jgi:AcrR family transcriptional regulator
LPIVVELDLKIKVDVEIECDTTFVDSEVRPLGRRDRRKAEARRRLLDAARQLIADGGVKGLRISDVTEYADLGFGTFYTYFDTKDALIEAVVAEALTRLASTIGGAALECSDPAEAASVSYRRFLRFGVDEPQLARVLVELDRAGDIFESAITPWARETLERGASSGRFDVSNIELSLTTVAASALAAIRAILAGRLDPGAATESSGAEMMLRGFGLDADAARTIAHRELPPLEL